jgi:hypothetical protein
MCPYCGADEAECLCQACPGCGALMNPLMDDDAPCESCDQCVHCCTCENFEDENYRL